MEGMDVMALAEDLVLPELRASPEHQDLMESQAPQETSANLDTKERLVQL